MSDELSKSAEEKANKLFFEDLHDDAFKVIDDGIAEAKQAGHGNTVKELALLATNYLHVILREVDRAVPYYVIVLEIEPTNKEALCAMAEHSLDVGDKAGVVDYVRRARYPWMHVDAKGPQELDEKAVMLMSLDAHLNHLLR